MLDDIRLGGGDFGVDVLQGKVRYDDRVKLDTRLRERLTLAMRSRKFSEFLGESFPDAAASIAGSSDEALR